ncbi:MAG: cytochrome c, partial [Caulobacteraceae bacterium]
THAKALVWQQRADFDAKMKNLGSAARLFQSAAAGGDLAAIKAAHGKLGQTCGACHDQYREEH